MSREAIERFNCFGGACGVIVAGDAPERSAARAAAEARDELLSFHERFSRFLPDSELSRLNRDPRERVPVTPLLAYLAATVRHAAELTGGLVDATLLGELRRAGYDTELPARLPLELALALAPARGPAGPAPEQRWRGLHGDARSGLVTRPPGVEIDSGGLGKGLFADVIAEQLEGHESFAVDCGGDLALGGVGELSRPVEVRSPFDGGVLHTFELARGGVATTGIGRRAWLGRDGRPAHHLLDPATGRPAYTGIVQATALAPSAVLAEVHAKAAVLSGPDRAPAWLPWGGVLVFEDGSRDVIPAPRRARSAARPAALAAA